jgi:GT2 family glycosyltransferase
VGTAANGLGAPPALEEQFGISVVVATYKRLERLAACLDAIESQTQRAEAVVVVTHEDPESGRYVVERAVGWPQLKLVEAGRGRSVAAYNAGLLAVSTPLVAYVDDDAVPNRDWLERIVATFREDERIAAVGGRDVILADGRPAALGRRRWGQEQVGRIQWSGRMTANHHLGTGGPRDVDVLKGVNMSFRRDAVAAHGFDDRMRGPGAVVHAELSICLPLRRQGLRIVYDPKVVVMHHPAPRPAGDHRAVQSPRAAFLNAHNEGLQILEYLSPSRQLLFMVWALLIGSTECPGLAASARDLAHRRPGTAKRLLAAQRGRLAAWWTRRLPRASLDQSLGRDHGDRNGSVQRAVSRPVQELITTSPGSSS